MRAGPSTIAIALITTVALAAIVGVGVKLRLEEPLSSPSLGAEDPYTHVVFTKEALERGWFGDSWHLGTSMYPPGMHAFAGIVAPLAGVSLYDFARFSPVAFGALAILGMFVLGARLGGPAAGLAAALVTAVMPEHVFRTNLFFPTALDLALLPALLLAFHHVLSNEGNQRYAAAAFFVLLSIPLAFMHPWAVPLFVAPAFVYALIRCARELPVERVAPSLVLPAASATLATAFAMASRWDKTESGFAGFLGNMGPLRVLSAIDFPPPVVFVILTIVIGTICAVGIVATVALARARAATPSRVRLAMGGLAGALAVLFVWVVASSDNLPRNVNYDHMLGVVPIALALVGLFVALAAPSRVGDLGLSLGIVLFPFTAFNVFHSVFWPERTVAYLSIAVALLAAASVGFAAQRASLFARAGRARAIAAPVAVLASVFLIATAVATHPPDTYSWYRLYTDDEFATFERLSEHMLANPGQQAVLYSWQPALLVKTLGEPESARYSPKFFQSASAREKILAEGEDAPRYVVVDKYLARDVDKGKADVSFLKSGYRVVDSSKTGSLVIYAKED